MGRTKASAKKIIWDRKSKKITAFYQSTPKETDGSSAIANAAGSSAKSPCVSRSVLKDVGNTPMRGAQIPQKTSKIGDVISEEDQEIEFKFITDGIKGEHVARGKANESLYSALMPMDIVKSQSEKNKRKELHLVDPHGKTAYNLGMPLKCLDEDTTFEMRFYPFGIKSKDHMYRYRRYDAKDENIVKFYVNTKSNRKILYSNALPKYIHSVCVFAVEGESLLDALCKDGRFLPTLKTTNWKMMSENNVFLSKYLVDKYGEKHFSVEFSQKSKRKMSLAKSNQTSESINSPAPEPLKSFSKSLLDQYPRLQEQGTLIKEVLNAEAETQNTSLKTLLKLQKTEFGKTTVNSTAARVIKMLAQRLHAVGCIEWDNQGSQGSATCFLLAGRYILTCHHVIRMIVGDGVEEIYWPEILNRAARVTFTYEGPHPPHDSFYSIEPWFGISEKNLDYALLKLQGNWDTFPRGLISLVSKEPYNGLVYIIGHPGGKEKTTDACTVITFIDRHPEIRRRLHGDQLLHVFSQYSFSESRSTRVLTYDTSFLEGSSGSPVIDSSGKLVAMHAAGYKYEHPTQSVIEFGWLLKEICSDIETKDKTLHKRLLRQDSMKNKDAPYSGECNDIHMGSDNDTTEDYTSGEAMEEEPDQPPAPKRKRSNL